jgi:hypothetical protein
MKTARTPYSIDTPIRVVAAAVVIGGLYLAGLVLIHQLVG